MFVFFSLFFNAGGVAAKRFVMAVARHAAVADNRDNPVIAFLLIARDRKLFHSITDCGAGGFSSAIGEMAALAGGARVRLLDQTLLPLKESHIDTDDPAVVAEAIRNLKVRGAPAIGIAAAYGAALSALHAPDDLASFSAHVRADITYSRPSAITS